MYVDMHRQRQLALGAEVSASASASGSAAIDPNATFNQIAGSTATSAEMDAEWGPYIDAARKFNFPIKPGEGVNPSQAVQFLMEAMPTIMSATGIAPPGSMELAAFAAGSSAEFSALVGGNYKPAAMIAVKAGAAFACYNLGIDPRIGQVTVEALQDGEITDKDFEAAGGVGGSIAGSTVAGIIGIPPCIGGLVGGIVGQAAGGAVASAFKIGGGKAEREAKRREHQQRAAAVRGQLTAMRNGVAGLIMQSRGQWWSEFDRIISDYSYQWQGLECSQVFGRFPLLWQNAGADPSPYFKYPYIGAACKIPINRNLARGTGCLDTRKWNQGLDPRGGVCAAAYGCPYPIFPQLGGADHWDERVIQAFAAYDIWWQPPPNRAAINDLWVQSLPLPDSRPTDPALLRSMRNLTYVQALADRQRGKEGCKSQRCRTLADQDMAKVAGAYGQSLGTTLEQALSQEGINAAANRISMDMVNSAGAYAAAMAVNAQRSELLKGKLDRAIAGNKKAAEQMMRWNNEVRDAESRSRIINAAVNFGALTLGGVGLAAALVKGARK